MSDEIKEILDILKTAYDLYDIELTYKQVNVLYDYITNLQKQNKHLSRDLAEAILFNQSRCEENKRLREENEKLTRFKYNIPNDKTTSVPTITKSYKKEYENYKSRCEKAIEYINKNILISFDKVGFKIDKVAGIVVNNLLNILNGGDE